MFISSLSVRIRTTRPVFFLALFVLTISLSTSLIASPASLEARYAPESAHSSNPGRGTVLLEEGFEDAWPPTGWSLFTTGSGFVHGTTGTPGSDGGPHSGSFYAFHNDNTNPQDGWLVTPALVPTATSELQFWHRNRWVPDFYDYSGVLVSTGSCDPSDGEFVELAEFGQSVPVWTLALIDLGAYDAQSICLGFRYTGDFSHEWYLDDVVIVEAGAPQIEVTPGAINASLVPGQSTTLPLEIGNIGTGVLEWSLAESANAGDCNDLQDLPWLSATPASGTLAEAASSTVTVALDSSGLVVDTYTAGLCITSNSVTDAELVVSVTFEVLPLPEIDVTPDSVSLTVFTGDGPTPVGIRIDNPGAAALNWTVQTTPASATLWLQERAGNSGIVSDFFVGSDAGAYAASDFEVTSAATVETIFAEGFDNTNTLAAQPEITWQIYADDNGVPAGHPEDGTDGASAVWTYTAAIGAPGVDITGNNIGLDLLAAGETLNLDPGTYWLSVFPSYNVTGAGGARWNWYASAQVGAETQLISPGIFNVVAWTPLSGLGVGFTDTAFRLDETVFCDFDWITPESTGGMVDAGSFVEFSIALDETGLPLGVYSGNLCIASDVPGEELVIVPVTLTIEDAPITGLSAANDGPVVIGDAVNLNASLTQGTNVSFDWDFGDGNIGSGPTPNHLYAATGVYTATVTASNSVSSEQATTVVQVLGLFTVGGTVSGLEGTGLVLQNNGGDDLAIAADGSFSFATALVDLSDYVVSVASQPTGPVQTCTVANGSGTLAGADVTDVQITCATETYTVGGSVSGLEGTGLVLQNNGGDDLVIAADGSFAFATALADLSDYAVSVASQPTGPIQTCAVSNAIGTLEGSNVIDVQVVCTTEPAAVSLSFASVDFGILSAGGEGVSSTVTLASDGTGELVISEITSPASPFQLIGGSCLPTPTILQPGESCDIEIRFAPAANDIGLAESSIEIISNAISSPDSISLRGVASATFAVPVLGPLGLVLMILLLMGLAWRQTRSARA